MDETLSDDMISFSFFNNGYFSPFLNDIYFGVNKNYLFKYLEEKFLIDTNNINLNNLINEYSNYIDECYFFWLDHDFLNNFSFSEKLKNMYNNVINGMIDSYKNNNLEQNEINENVILDGQSCLDSEKIYKNDIHKYLDYMYNKSLGDRSIGQEKIRDYTGMTHKQVKGIRFYLENKNIIKIDGTTTNILLSHDEAINIIDNDNIDNQSHNKITLENIDNIINEIKKDKNLLDEFYFKLMLEYESNDLVIDDELIKQIKELYKKGIVPDTTKVIFSDVYKIGDKIKISDGEKNIEATVLNNGIEYLELFTLDTTTENIKGKERIVLRKAFANEYINNDMHIEKVN
jgi:hypothetical protein